ncbi:unnamed protein product [Effrenium voratum]|nr:unnamed protein product [Effrenium voratum]
MQGEKGDKVKEKGGKSKASARQGSQGSPSRRTPRTLAVRARSLRSVPVTGAKMASALGLVATGPAPRRASPRLCSAQGKGKIERVKRADAGGKQPIEAKGTTCQAIMIYAEKTPGAQFGKSEKGKLEMDIADVKVQLKRHTDKTTKQEVVTDIFVAWGHQQEKDSPLTVHEIAERFDKLYQDVGGHGSGGAKCCDALRIARERARTLTILTMPREPRVRYSATRASRASRASRATRATRATLARYMAQQAARHLDRFLGVDCLGARRKGPGPAPVGVPRAEPPASGAAALPADVPDADVPDADADVLEEATPGPSNGESEREADAARADFAPPKPRLLQIVDPHSGKPIDTMGMNFAPSETRG